LTLKPGDKILIKTNTNVKTIKAACNALKRFKRRVLRGGRSLGRYFDEKFFIRFVAFKDKCVSIFALVGQIISHMKGEGQREVAHYVENLKVLLLNAVKVVGFPITLIVAVVYGLIALYTRRSASKDAAKAQQAVVDATAALVQAQQDAVNAETEHQTAEDRVDEAEKKLEAALQAQQKVMDDDDIFGLDDVLREVLEATKETDEANAASLAAMTKLDLQDVAAVAAQQALYAAEDAAIAARDVANAALVNSKWNTFKDAFKSILKIEKFTEKEEETKEEKDAKKEKEQIAKEENEKKANEKKEANKKDDDEAITDKEEADAAVYFEKSQMWMITGSPTRNPYNGLSNNVINIPVHHFRLRASNLSNIYSGGEEIANNTKLKVKFQKFSKDD